MVPSLWPLATANLGGILGCVRSVYRPVLLPPGWATLKHYSIEIENAIHLHMHFKFPVVPDSGNWKSHQSADNMVV